MKIKNNYLTETDTILLKDLWFIIEQNKQEIISSFYTYLEKLDESKAIWDNYEKAKLELAFSTWLFELFHKKYGSDYIDKRKALGRRYRSLQIPMRLILLGFLYLKSSINYYILKEISIEDHAKANRLSSAVNKMLDIELLLISNGYGKASALKTN